jgi:hypothetical protein
MDDRANIGFTSGANICEIPHSFYSPSLQLYG